MTARRLPADVAPRDDIARVLCRIGGELARGARICADIETALSDLISVSGTGARAVAGRLQRLDELRQTLDDLSRLHAALGAGAGAEVALETLIEEAVRQRALQASLLGRAMRTGSGDGAAGSGDLTWL